MITNAAKLRASVVETPEGEDNLIQIAYNNETYSVSDVKWVMDYVNPVGLPCPMGCLREVKESDFTKIIDENIECRIQKNDKNELILHYITQPQ